jgi:signal-transduction protein with cAMP-binding, CBS, and nucleotidyltransferase domain
MFWRKSEPKALQNKRALLKPFDLSKPIENHLLERMNERLFNEGEVVVREGEEGDSLYIVSHGTLKVVKRSDAGQEVDIATISAGDFFGEMAWFKDRQRTCTVIALENCKLFEIVNSRSVEYGLKDELKKAFLLRRHNTRLKLRQHMDEKSG